IDTYDNVGNNTGLYGLRYSEIDMSLAAGQGSVTSKNNVLFIPSTLKMAAVKHCNGTDVWLVSHDRNTDVFRTFLITATGISTAAVTSTVGTIHADYEGYLKFSPDGNKVATSIWPTYNLEMYDFNRSTGIISNQLVLKTGTDAFGCEFSSDGTKFYSVVNWSQILQWDLCAGTAADIMASQTAVGTSSALLNGMQLAPNGKIYVARTGQQYLGEIQNPNAPGTLCNYSDLGLSIAPNQCYNGLPNFMASYLAAPAPTLLPFSSSYTCQSLAFIPPVNSGSLCKSFSSYHWDFGDAASGAANTSTLANPTHNFYSTGTFTVKLILSGNCNSDSLIQTVQVAGCTGINELSNRSMLVSVSPNPASNQLQINCGQDSELFVYNELGAVVFNQSVKKGNSTLNVACFANGVYFLKAVSGQGQRTVKFVKLD
ncbi:MAG: T9SS type A sorting domain-containing protein, partial [Bacteroidia bacterium]|nr:T9SS type A sorting domain-containing protein [Bacteroidia bacterium]